MLKRKTIAAVLAGACLLGTLCMSHAETAPLLEGTDHTAIEKVTDYLYEVTYDGYEKYEEPAQAFFSEVYRTGAVACSSVQNGRIRGRNYDWYLNDNPALIVHVPAAEGRHASIGVARTKGLNCEALEQNQDAAVLELLPYGTLDGINDAGLCLNLNVVTAGEMGAFEFKTDDPSDDLHPMMIIRLALDRCGSVQEVLDMIAAMDVYPINDEFEAHLMISGKTSPEDETYKVVVVEFIPDEAHHYQMNVIDEFVDGKAVMTNFHLTGFDGSVETLTPHAMGFERWQELVRCYDQGSDVPGMITLMKKAYFTRSYDLYNDNFWYTEFSKGDLTVSNRGEAQLNGDLSKAGDYRETIEKEIAVAKKGDRTAETDKSWQTVHMSVYDTEALELTVVPQEGSLGFKFDLAGRIG
ncbi:MAG: hypothetical protein Q4C53_08740 [Clostridia bacterium]|nr:hypothetical protein [Clostridia bacterium]